MMQSLKSSGCSRWPSMASCSRAGATDGCRRRRRQRGHDLHRGRRLHDRWLPGEHLGRQAEGQEGVEGHRARDHRRSVRLDPVKPTCQRCGAATWTDDGRCRDCQNFPTLGYEIGRWIEERCAIPDRDQVGDPYLLTDEQWTFLLHFYRVNPHAEHDAARNRWRSAFHYTRGGQLCRPQKWGKGPFSGAVVCAEAAGPVVFDGWNAEGKPVGRQQATPVIQLTALSEDQTDNV